ncbi:hypothetical protein GF362_03210 [Candidatus Dojkabacteria bacterium]|nr:hypothetical protein [Candidatus Dojkabacteria bacterium]
MKKKESLKLTELEMQRLVKFFEILIKIDKRTDITGYQSKNARYNKNKHNKLSNN